MAKVSTKQSFSHKLLKALAVGGLVAVAATNPYFGLNLVRGIRKDLERRKWRQFYQDLHHLRRQKRIEIAQDSQGQYLVTLTDLGRKVVSRYDLDALTIKRPKKWDGRWRFFSFDIPGHKKTARRVLLAKLKELNFIMVQKSLWAHPFECRNELKVIAKAFEVESHTLSLVADETEREHWLAKKFEETSGIVL